jgi:hypothetical protein
MSENAVDTRHSNGPKGRTYSAPFARVWDLLVREIERRRRWTLVHADEDRGLLTVRCRPYLPPSTNDLTVWVGLDNNGLTRVDMRSTSRSAGRDFGSNARRVGELLGRLDDILGIDAQVHTGH